MQKDSYARANKLKIRKLEKNMFGNCGLYKRGVSLWLSWVLITAFAVALGTLIYRWSADYARNSASDIEVRASRAECDNVAIEIASACQTDDVVYLEVSNKKGLKIDKIIFSMYDPFGNAESREKILTLDVGTTVSVEVLKQGAISTVSATPAFQKESKWVVCPEKEVEYSKIRYC